MFIIFQPPHTTLTIFKTNRTISVFLLKQQTTDISLKKLELQRRNESPLKVTCFKGLKGKKRGLRFA